jgi:hypothetical protein
MTISTYVMAFFVATAALAGLRYLLLGIFKPDADMEAHTETSVFYRAADNASQVGIFIPFSVFWLGVSYGACVDAGLNAKGAFILLYTAQYGRWIISACLAIVIIIIIVTTCIACCTRDSKSPGIILAVSVWEVIMRLLSFCGLALGICYAIYNQNPIIRETVAIVTTIGMLSLLFVILTQLRTKDSPKMPSIANENDERKALIANP